MKIRRISAQEILDSRGFPTIECFVELSNGFTVSASVPAGASVGSNEAYELRDDDNSRFMGKGVLKAVDNINTVIAPLLSNKQPDIVVMDALLKECDGSENKSVLGANSILATSISIMRAQAYIENKELFELAAYLQGQQQPSLPRCMFNLLNGGMHANNRVLFQEFMVMPQGKSFSESLHCAVTIYHTLKQVLEKAGYLSTVGDEGGFAPMLKELGTQKEKIMLDFLMKAIEKAGFVPGIDVSLCLDVAATHFYDPLQKVYCFDGECLSASDMVSVYKKLVADYPIVSIEDGMSEGDDDGWQFLTKELGKKVQIVGDDIFVTNSAYIRRGLEKNLANAVLIKPNQIGSVTEAFNAACESKVAGFSTVASHRSGETNDSFIADFSVGSCMDQLKAGAPARGERVAKYNRLLAIERTLSR